MKTIIDFFARNSYSGALVMLIEEKETFLGLKELFSFCKYEEIFIFSSSMEVLRYIKRIWRLFFEMNKFKSSKVTFFFYSDHIMLDRITKKIDTVFFDSGVKASTVISLEKLNPRILIGRMWRSPARVFLIWEKYKEFADNIFIQNIKDDGDSEILVWNKEDYAIELSIILPVFKVEKYIEKCLETITAWNAKYIEFLFIDDGSPDKSVEIVEKYRKNDSRIRIISKKNEGCASARKLGLELAKGRYVGFIDPDDFIDRQMYRKLFSRAIVGGYDISYCGYNKYYNNSGKVEKVEDSIGDPFLSGIHDEYRIRQLIYGLRVAIWRGIYRKDFLMENQITFFKELKRFDDLPFKVQVFTKAKSVVAIPEYLYFYRLEREEQDVSCTDERLYIHFEIFEYLDKWFSLIKNRRLLDYLQIVKIQTHFYALEKLEHKYRREYLNRMRKDLTKNAATLRTLLLLLHYAEKSHIFLFILSKLHMTSALRIWLSKREKKKILVINEKREIVNKLREIYEQL